MSIVVDSLVNIAKYRILSSLISSFNTKPYMFYNSVVTLTHVTSYRLRMSVLDRSPTEDKEETHIQPVRDRTNCRNGCCYCQ